MKHYRRILSLLIALILTMSFTPKDEKAQLIYIGDPMCSWCYGFAPELEKTVKNLPSDVQFSIVLGGLRANGTENFTDLKDFLEDHWKDVSKRTGQKFNYDILNKGALIYNTEPACRAVATVRKLKPEAALDYFVTIQEGFYFNNYHPTKIETFAKQAVEFGISEAEFTTLFNSKEMLNATNADFIAARKMGVNSFPSVVLVHNGKNYLIAQGYATSNDILKKVNKILAK